MITLAPMVPDPHISDLPNWPVLVRAHLPSPMATDALAARLAGVLKAGDTLLLSGELGSGKTHLARALIRARMDPDAPHEDIPSPSFTLVQCYDIPGGEIWHADLYRLTHPDDILELGLDEAMEKAICLIEWPERLAPDWPSRAVLLRLQTTGDDARAMTLAGKGDLADRLSPVLRAAS